MRTILAYEDLGEDFHALYRTVLVDTPVGLYFTQFLADFAADKAADADSVRSAFADIPMTIIESAVKKFYLEDFYAFCKCVAPRGGVGRARGPRLWGGGTPTYPPPPHPPRPLQVRRL